MLLLALLASSDFRVVQYAQKPVALRGCADCQGQPEDDVCEVRAGLASQPLDDYAKQRWPVPGRLKLIRSKAESDCAVPSKSLLGPRAQVELAAVRIATAPPAAALLDKLGPAVDGWPHRLVRHPAAARKPDRAALREAVVCWPSVNGWPSEAHGDARPLDRSNRCEAWLLAVKPDTGEPDLDGASFPIQQTSFAYAPPAAPPVVQETPAPVPRPPPPPPAARARSQCGDGARSHSATLDRFDQWDLQIRAAARSSLDRASWTLDAAAWAGHCQELDVLRAALEQQLSCTVTLSGRCAPADAR